jgi:hypothetical protein
MWHFCAKEIHCLLAVDLEKAWHKIHLISLDHEFWNKEAVVQCELANTLTSSHPAIQILCMHHQIAVLD